MTEDIIEAEPEANPAETWRRSLGYDEQEVHAGGKRCGVQWTPWMGGWFSSWSPHNSNSNAEGSWDHWVDLAIKILRDPLTELVRPDAHDVAVRDLPDPLDLYDQTARDLTDAELMKRFRRTEATS